MAWAFITSATLTNSSSAASSPWNAGNLGAALSANDRMWASVCYNAAAGTPVVSALSDSLGNTWRKELSGSVTGSGATLEFSVWSAVSGAGTPSSITVTFAGGTGGFGIGIAVASYSGLSTAADGSEIDISKITMSPASGVDSGTTTTPTTAAANELKLGLFADWGSGVTLGAGASDGAYTMRANRSPVGDAQAAVEDRDSGASGSTARATFTGGGGDTGTGVVVVKLFSAVTTIPNKIVAKLQAVQRDYSY